MCGILSIMDTVEDHAVLRSRALDMARRLRHRGPDASGIYSDEHITIAHERLSIIDPESGAQPLIDVTTGSVLAVNGEIYDYKEQAKKLTKTHEWQTKSDCEVLLYLYDEYGTDFLKTVDGIFSFVLYDKQRQDVLIARDHIGIIPLYYGYDALGQMYVASELKSLDPYCQHIEEFPPGHYYKQSEKKFVKWYTPSWQTTLPTKSYDAKELHAQLEKAVKRQLMADVPFGVLISGGLDSSYIAALAVKHSTQQLHSFAIGLAGSPDLKHARVVADHLGTQHHEITYTIGEGLDAIPDVIYHLETYDVTTIRAATPMYLMARKIKSLGIKMVLSGEGADEVFGGYLYFHKAPDKKEFHEETVRKLASLSKYDCLRANKAMSAWGIEARVPFLDREFLDYAMHLDPQHKMCGKGKIEKHIVREAAQSLLPKSVVWRQKEQFSDGVGYGWIDTLKDVAKQEVSDHALTHASQVFVLHTPTSKEEYRYRSIFEQHFKCKTAPLCVPVGPTIACSTPTAIQWDKAFADMADASGRSVGVHEEAYVK